MTQAMPAMRDRESGGVGSFFPPAEGSSFGSRPTPVIPAPLGLRRFGEESPPPSVRVTAEETVEEEAASIPAPPVVEAAPLSQAPPSSSGMEHKFWDSAPSTAPPSLMPPIEAPARRRGARTKVAKVLFAVLFGAVVTLLGYAVKQQLSRADAGSPAWLSSAK